MDGARWRRLKRILEEARELDAAERDAYLREACGTDAALRAEAESLIGHGERDREFLTPSPGGVEAESPRTLAGGARLGPYEIIELIGAGGMGEVYRAKDTKLGREVALEILPEPFANSRERLNRFEREAKLRASLNHPNVATLFDLEEEGGFHFLTMELVEGETLAERDLARSILNSRSSSLARSDREGARGRS